MNSDRQLREEVVARMQQFAVDVRLGERDNRYEPTQPIPVEAALETLRWYQDQLLDLEPDSVDRELARDLTRKRDWALFALVDHDSKAWAKREQLRVTGGRPLAICTGGGYPTYADTDLGKMPAWTEGCFKVFEEEANIKGRKWGRLCPRCRASGGHRNPQRDARRALRATVKEFIAGRTEELGT